MFEEGQTRSLHLYRQLCRVKKILGALYPSQKAKFFVPISILFSAPIAPTLIPLSYFSIIFICHDGWVWICLKYLLSNVQQPTINHQLIKSTNKHTCCVGMYVGLWNWYILIKTYQMKCNNNWKKSWAFNKGDIFVLKNNL